MEVGYSAKAMEDIAYWKKSGNKKIQQKIAALIFSIEETPFLGIGSPEALKHNLAKLWSRRINQEHRLMYEVSKDTVIIHPLLGHYNQEIKLNFE